MQKLRVAIIAITLICFGTAGYALLKPKEGHMITSSNKEKIKLPEPKYKSETSVEEALLKRRSVREFKNEPLTLAELSQLLWAAQGITEPEKGFRTAPSAGALYPLEVYVAIGNVKEVPQGVYVYKPQQHEIIKVKDEDMRAQLSDAALGQQWIEDSPMVIVLAAVYERTTQKYGDRGIRYVHMEEGHATQNVYLQAVSLNLGTVVVGAFGDNEVRKTLNMADNENPLCIMPVGRM